MNIDYGHIIAKSFKDLKQNPKIVLFLILLSLAIAIVVGIPVVATLLLGSALFTDALASPASIIYWVAVGVIDIVLVLAAWSYIFAANNGMIYDAASGRKVTLQGMLLRAKQYFRTMLTFLLAMLVLMIAFYLLLLLLFLAVMAVFAASPAAGIIIGMLLLMLGIALFLVIAAMTIFTLPILMVRKIGGFKAIMEAVSYSKAHLGHAILTLLLVIAIGIAGVLLELLVGAPYIVLDFMRSLGTQLGPGMWTIYSVSYALSTLANMIMGLIGGLFVFNAYLASAPKKY